MTTVYASSKMDSPKTAVTPSVGPSQVTSLTYSGGQGISTTSLRSPTVSNGGILASSQSIFDRGGRVKATTVSTPGGSFTLNGTSCTYDAAGRLELAKDAANTITKTVYDDLDRPVDILQAVSTYDLQSVGDGDLREITHYDYDSRGNLWKVTQYAGNDSSLTTVMGYDGRNRLSSTTGPDGVRTRYTWDNLGRLTSVRTYDSQDHLIATTDMRYDERGQVYQTEEYGVSLGQARVTKYWHDDADRVWKTVSVR